MNVRGGSGVNRIATRPVTSLIYFAVLLGILLATCQQASALPAFARKYGMPCSSCHEAWPMLSPFGQQFKDNGYQMGNDRDAPIFQQAAYWPVTFRMTPVWHRESTDKMAVDSPDGTPLGSEAKVTTHGFDWSGLDFHTGGTLAKNFSFYVLPSSDNTGAFHFETVFARLDNIAGSSWLNIKLGKFELDNLLSEKRILTLTNVSGVYENYHFQPVGESYTFGIGDNQVGLEWMGHSKDDRTRVSAALLSSNDGSPGLPTSRGYDGFFAASRAFEVGGFGLQRVGAFAYFGEAPTYYQFTQTAPDQDGVNQTVPVAGTGIGNKGFQRYGLIGMWYIKKFDITTIYFHGHDSAWLGTNTAATPGATLPTGAHSPSWNGGLFESHYMPNPQIMLINRYELTRMSQQAFGGAPTTYYTPYAGNLGNADVLTFGLRYYPFISSRAGFAYHAEYAIIWQKGVSPVTATNTSTSSLLFGFDFAF
ncbi:MAG TPA: hypothetical protein VJX70_09575 [Candidatus Acidoferrum sp.]|nr:hypothetical protein [Candidatus Acidoferrum sp.]